MKALTWPQARARWLTRSHLIKPMARSQLVQAVSDVCGVQAQVLTAAELAIGARVTGVTQRDVEDALWQKRTLIKTCGPRGTLHLLPSHEAPLWSAALRALPLGEKRQWFEQYNLSAAQGQALFDAMRDALDGRTL